MITAKDLYDFFTPVEDAVGTVFAANMLTCYTLKQKYNPTNPDDTVAQTFQKQRARVEVVFSIGEGQGIHYPQTGKPRASSGWLHDLARKAGLSLSVISNAGGAAEVAFHRELVAMVLFSCDTLAELITNTGKLPHHFIEQMSVTDCDLEPKTEDGFLKTAIGLDVDIVIKTASMEAFLNQ